jgi:AraC family transcriptional regulator
MRPCVLDRLDLPRVTATLRSYPPLLHQPAHAHDESGLSLVLQGSVEETAGRSADLAGPGSVVVKPAGVVHADRFGPGGATLLSLTFRGDPGAAAGRYAWLRGAPVAALLRGWRARDGAALESAALDLLAGAPGTEPRWLASARERLHAERARPPASGALAAAAGVHRVHLARAFRARQRCTISEYVRGLRVQTAAELLAGTDWPLALVALETGFADQAHLTRVFRALVGVTPRRYRMLRPFKTGGAGGRKLRPVT